MSDVHSNSSSDNENDLVIVDYVSDYNPDHILPQKPDILQLIREWLRPTAYNLPSGEFRKHLATHMAGTGSWITSDEAFQTWINGTDDGLLWIQGVPGSGKSVVAASLIEHLRQIEPNCTVLFFFFRQIIDANHKPQALLRDWMHQILDKSPVLQAKLAGYLDQGRSIDQMGMEDLWKDLRIAFSAASSKVFCIADALDEMDQGYDSFITELGNIGRWLPEKVKVLMTSRPVPKLEPPLRALSPKRLRLQTDQVDRDIATFVYRSLEKSSIPKDDWTKVTSAVPGRANGIFLYAKLAMDAFLEDGAQLDKVLSQLPEDLNVLYTKLLEEHARRSTVSPQTQRLILQSVTHARRPLRLLELAELLLQSSTEAGNGTQTLKESKDLVRAACGPLLEILPDETVSVIHHSFTEYLKGTTRSNAQSHNHSVLDPGSAHDQLARACLQYLLSGCLRSVKIDTTPMKQFEWQHHGFDVGGNPEMAKVALKYPFAKYAVKNWDYHVRQSEAANYDQKDSCALIAAFLDNEVCRKPWLELAWPDTYRGTLDVTQLHIASQVGLSAYTQSLLPKMDVDAVDGQGKTPLWWAADCGHKETVAILLSAGADPDKNEFIYGLKPLHQAAAANHADVLSLLLEAGVDPLTPKTKEDPGLRCGHARSSVGDTALYYACCNNHSESINVLLRATMKTDPQGVLLSALKQKQSEIVAQIVSEPGFDVNFVVAGQTPLQVACAYSDIQSMKRLLHAGADPKYNLPKESRGPRLPIAIMTRDYEDQRDKRARQFCLHALASSAVEWQNHKHENERERGLSNIREMFSILLDQGLNIDHRDRNGSTCLHYAANSTFMINLLLDAGADANATDFSGCTPLFYSKSKQAISLLVERGHADVNHKNDALSQSPLSWMLSNHKPDCALALLEHNPDCTITDCEGNGPLHCAVSSFRNTPDIITALVARGANPNLRNNNGIPPLLKLYSGLCDDDDSLRALLDAGADINIVDRQGRTKLFRDIGGMDFTDIDKVTQRLRIMMERGASISCRDNNGRTLLHEAVSRFGLEKIAAKKRLLAFIDLGMDLHAVDYAGNTLLHEFANRNDTHSAYKSVKCVAAFQALVDLGLDIERKNHKGQTVLHVLTSKRDAYEYYNSKSTRGWLIDKVIPLMGTVNVCDNNGVTPLHISSTLGSTYTKKLLDAGADATVQTHEELTALHLAVRARQSNVVGLLIDHLRARSKQEAAKSKTNPNRNPIDSEKWFTDQVNRQIHDKQYDSYTPLHFACRSGQPETVNILLQNGAKWDDQTLISACKAFQFEDRLWRDENGALHPPVLLAHTHRQAPKRSYSSSTLQLPLAAEARMESIIDMLFSRGLLPERPYYGSGYYGTQSHSPRDMEPWTDESLDYVDTCIERIFYKYAPVLEKWHDTSFTTPRAIHKAVFEATKQSLCDSAIGDRPLLTKGTTNSELVVKFLVERKYYAVELLQQLGVDFLVKSDKCGMSNIALLVSHGFAELVDIIGSAEARDRFSEGEWHAFGDPNRPGLQRDATRRKDNVEDEDEDEKIDLYEDIPLLIRAIQRVQPNLEVVKVLTEKLGVSLNEIYNLRNGESSSALLHASEGITWWHANQAIPYLIEAGADLEVTNSAGQTPLLVALIANKKGSLFAKDACRALVVAGANVHAVDSQGMSCLARAEHDVELLQLLLDYGAIATPKALLSAIDSERVDAVRVLLSQALDPNMRPSDSNALAKGKTLPDWDDSQFAFERFTTWHNNPIEPQQLFALHHASRAKSSEAGAQMVKMLLDSGADPLAKYLRETEAMRLKQHQGSNDDNLASENELEEDEDDSSDAKNMRYVNAATQPTTPTTAVSRGYEECTVLHDLLEAGKAVDEFFRAKHLDVNHRDAKGQTLLLAASTSTKGLDRFIHFATDEKQSDVDDDKAQQMSVLQKLLSLGADVEARDNEGRNVLHLIGSRNTHNKSSCTESVKEICRLAPHMLNQADARGCTPLHCALVSRYGDTSLSLAKELLELGADATAVTSRGDTALHLLSPGLNKEPVQSLFMTFVKEHGLKINQRNNRGETPLFGWCRAGYSHQIDAVTREFHGQEELDQVKKMTEILREFGADFFATDKWGRGLLHILGYATADRFQWFMDLGLDPLLEDKKQRTAIDVAAADENEEVLKLFERDNGSSA